MLSFRLDSDSPDQVAREATRLAEEYRRAKVMHAHTKAGLWHLQRPRSLTQTCTRRGDSTLTRVHTLAAPNPIDACIRPCCASIGCCFRLLTHLCQGEQELIRQSMDMSDLKVRAAELARGRAGNADIQRER
jgi:hypothetical protein